MQIDSYPLAVLYGYGSKRNELSFVGRKGIVVFSGERFSIEKILRLCNGVTSVQDIISQLPTIGAEKITQLLTLCEERGIVRDSRRLLIGFHEDSSNPPFFSYDNGHEEIKRIMSMERVRQRAGDNIQLPGPVNSDLAKMIQKRKSVRQFRKGQISLNQLSGLLKVTYGIEQSGHWSVASGGGLYPLDLYLIVPNDDQALSCGIYRWSPEKNNLSRITSNDPRVWLAKVFNTKDLLKNAAGILCVTANLDRMISKYANRGYLLTLLEAGHAAQNAYLYCAEQNIGAVEYCGFCDEMVARELGLQFPRESVVTTMIVGIPETNGKISPRIDHEMTDRVNRLKSSLVGDDKPIIDVFFWEPRIKGYALPQWGATATYRPTTGSQSASVLKNNRGFATGSTTSEAVIKALAEGFERYALQQRRVDICESLQNLRDMFVDPRQVVPYSRIQHKILNAVELFDPKRKIDWVYGYRERNGERVCVPSDLVFFAPKTRSNERGIFYRASSSGVAAHFDKQIAIQTAIYELFERDAFCVTWYSKRQVRRVPNERLSVCLKSRVRSWEKMGYTVSLLDISLDGPPIALAMIWSDKKTPALFSGASCRSSFDEAADRAFSEAELMGITWHYRRPKRAMDMRDILDVEDHGRFYLDPKNLVHLDWLLRAEESKITQKDFDGDLNAVDPVVVDVTPPSDTSGLVVVRALSEKLMPINFGYGTEHYGHSRLAVLGYKWSKKYPAVPHFFA